MLNIQIILPTCTKRPLSFEDIKTAHKKIVDSLSQLLASGMIYTQVADLFHNNQDDYLKTCR